MRRGASTEAKTTFAISHDVAARSLVPDVPRRDGQRTVAIVVQRQVAPAGTAGSALHHYVREVAGLVVGGADGTSSTASPRRLYDATRRGQPRQTASRLARPPAAQPRRRLPDDSPTRLFHPSKSGMGRVI